MMDLNEYVNVLRKRWLTIAVTAILGAVAGYGWAATTTPTYQATSKVFVSLSNGNTVNDLVQGSTFTQNLVQSYAQLVPTPAVLDPIIAQLGLDTTARRLAKSVAADTPLNTVIIEISVTDSRADRASQIANAVAAQLPRTVDSLSPSTTATEAAVTIRTISQATVPSFAISPNTRLRTVLGFGLGILAGVAIAVVRRLTDTRVHGEEDLATTVDLPVLGAIPRWSGAAKDRISVIRRPQSPRSEAYRRLRSNLEFVRRGGDAATSVVITSSVPGEGKTTTAINLAASLAEQGDRVLLVDADLRRPSVAESTGLEGSVGLSTILIGKVDLGNAIQHWGDTTLDVLTSGAIPPNPLNLIDSQAMLDLIEKANASYDFVVIDSPPLLSVVDAAVLSHQCDGPLVVAAAGRTKRRQVATALEALTVAGVSPIGMILTRAPRDEIRDYRYYTSTAPESGSLRRAFVSVGHRFSRSRNA
ncbi:polysaccharide biosynthesis tyrosine autokinase [Aeromicrobium sp.]|uniref:polysaccharide biosynthesis tyrosine autokinase n=1 Tax=Aeromicrobium sp. TaxID=1871063 RepID=UPI0019C7C010|nr:polysaccharide biosynthesis tyrosine autokinase [Aeromicrobium sp.]MBC7632320.1 polysaccharide biosynthesis tyrosine autokinase [Aeromicrobium sp.]